MMKALEHKGQSMTPDTPNIDTEEVRRFETQADTWWDPGGDFKGLHDINPLRLDYISQRTPLSGKRVLDVGCGGA